MALKKATPSTSSEVLGILLFCLSPWLTWLRADGFIKKSLFSSLDWPVNVGEARSWTTMEGRKIRRIFSVQTWQQPLVAWLFCTFLSAVASADIPVRNITFSTGNGVVVGRNVSFTPGNNIVSVPVVHTANDLCLAFPCQNNATCVPSATNPGDAFSCACSGGWTGRLCDVDVDECSIALNPCKNGAMCRNSPGGFQCRS